VDKGVSMTNEMNHMDQIISLDIIQTIINHSDNVYLLRIALTTKLRDLLSCKLTVFVQYNIFSKDHQIVTIESASSDHERNTLEQDVTMIQPELMHLFNCVVSDNSYSHIPSFSKFSKLITIPLIHENQMLGTILLFDPSPLYKLDLIHEVMEKIQPYVSIVLYNAISYSEMENIIYLRTKELNKAIFQVNESSKAKSLFLANMSHEMRTPLNGIIGFLDLLLKKETDATKLDYLKKIEFASHSLLHLISEVLDLSRIEFDSFDLYETEFDLQKTIEDIVSLHMPKAQSKGLDFHIQIKGIPNNPIIGDLERFKQIINNLLSNAIKFTTEGSVELIIECEPSMITFEEEVIETRLKFKCDVVDTGKGINEKNLEKIFEIFSQEDQTTTREYGGTGLGLAIAQRLIQLMNGEIHVDSTIGSGSVFSFYIMLQYTSSEDYYADTKLHLNSIQNYDKAIVMDDKSIENLSVIENSLIENSLISNSVSLDSVNLDSVNLDSFIEDEGRIRHDNLNLLVVDDNELNAQLINEILKLNNYYADFALNGLEAVTATKEHMYDIILMDCQMPIMDGLEATKLIRQQQVGRKKPYIIALTAASSDWDRINCIESGMDDYITKPINMDIIIRKIEKYAQLSKKNLT